MKNIYMTFTNINANIRALFKDQHSRVVLENDVDCHPGSDALVIHIGVFEDKNADSAYVKFNNVNGQDPVILGMFADTFANAGYSIEFNSIDDFGQQRTLSPCMSLLINEQRFFDVGGGKLKESAYKFNICINRLYNRLFNA